VVVCFVLFFVCVYLRLRISWQPKSIAGVPFDSVRRFRPYYCAPLVCIFAVIGLLAVWRHNKPKTKSTWLRTKGQSAGYPQAHIEHHFQFFPASSTLVSSSLAVLLEVKTTRFSAVLSFHLSQCFTPPLKSIPASFFPHAPCLVSNRRRGKFPS